ncbi:MFS transporter [Bacillus massiliigorillae]|uniref:MFS transporter n=1 Tax=Bacillus massiliigorillae TaxID=1243664 RepID=UPI00039EBA2C|nr:MFS transporter [Bacillus massiliigorillae]
MVKNLNQWVALFLIVIAELFALSVWFSASAVISQLQAEWHLNLTQKSFITVAVQAGFIFGAVLSSLFGIPDHFNTKKIFIISSFLAGFFNCFIIFSPSIEVTLLLRFLTGVSLAGVYPIAIKLVTLWFKGSRSISVGILIAGLTLGSALPHMIASLETSLNWKTVIIFSSTLAFISSLLIFLFLPNKENNTSKTKLSLDSLKSVLKDKKVMLANYGYWFHMWELYAMWTWLPTFLYYSFSQYGIESYSSIVAFLAIGVSGAIGCIVGGIWASKIGKENFSIIAMTLSGLSALAIGFTFHINIGLTIIVACIWGASIIADSGQFSAMVSEYAKVKYIGTALTFQMAIGFLLTIFSIYLISFLEPILGWQLVFIFLSVGPLLGVIPMFILNKLNKRVNHSLRNENKNISI